MKIEWNKLTWYSKLAAAIFFFIILPPWIIYLSALYQQVTEAQNQLKFASSNPVACGASATTCPAAFPVVTPTAVTATSSNLDLVWPISDAASRVTKKPFGIYVTPYDSPVSPEKFTGYHTGVDFETTAQEQNIEVPVKAICEGSLVLKKTASGYGGVAVQSCKINNQSVTVVYGHLRLASITIPQNTILKPGQQIGVLGKGYSTETDGERKHLHLAIHKGTVIDLLGYVQNKSGLSGWIDFMGLMK